MRTRHGLEKLALLGLALAGTGCPLPSEPTHPPCDGAFAPGQSLVLRLGVSYDAKSDYFFDGTVLPVDYAVPPSCSGIDGMTTGQVVTFTTRELVPVSTGTCSAWGATFQPESAQMAREAFENDVPLVPGVTIAAGAVSGTLLNKTLIVHRGLFTPSGDPSGTAAPRRLPPLAVTRHLRWDDGSAACFDAWVATWETPP